MNNLAVRRMASVAALTVPLAIVAALAPSKAQAGCCVAYDYGHSSSKHGETQAHFTAKLAETEAAIVEALRLMTGQLSGNLKEQLAGAASIATSQDHRTVQRKIEEERVTATVEAASGASTCNVITGTVAGRNLDDRVAQWRAELASTQVMWDAGDVGASRLGGAAAVERRLQTHCRFATEGDVAAGLCQAVAPQGGQGRDLMADNLLHAYRGVLSDEDAAAAEMFLSTALTPEPLGRLPRDAAATADGRRKLADRHASIARASVATAVASSLAASRMPFDQQVVGADGESRGLREWADDMAKQTLGYDPEGGNFPNGVSKAAWLELRSKSWFQNPNWALTVDTQNVDQTAKDLAMMQAYQVYQVWELHQQLEKMNLTMATMLAIMEERNRAALY